MKKICFLPPLANGLNALSATTAAGLAAPYDEVVLTYPKFTMTGGAFDNLAAIEQTNAVLQLLNGPVWIQVDAQWPQYDADFPTTAYNEALAATQQEIATFWTQLPASMKPLVKGFTFDHADYDRQFGYLVLARANGVLTRFNRFYANSLVSLCRGYMRPCMLISNRVGDLVGNVYRFADADNPGAAAWPSILGQDSTMADWLVARDVFYTPSATSTEEVGYTAAPDDASNVYLNLCNAFWQFFEALPVLRRVQSSNLAVGIVQHMDFSAESSDGLLGPALSTNQISFLTGLATLLQLTDIDGYGVMALGTNGFYPSLEQVNNPVATPTPSGPAVFYTLAGAVYADFATAGKPSRVITTQTLSAFTISTVGGS